MACESEWAAYQQAIADRIASEIVEAAAIAARQAAQEAEWTACMAWWYCGQQGVRTAPQDVGIPSLEEAKAGFWAAEMARKASQGRLAQLHLQYERVAGKAYDGGKS